MFSTFIDGFKDYLSFIGKLIMGGLIDGYPLLKNLSSVILVLINL
jgi:hypothetical protein